MSSPVVSLILFACVYGGALLGSSLRSRIPEQYLGSDSKDVVKLATGLIGTMSALVLGLLVASAKSSYDKQKDELTQIAAEVALLDRALAHYGPETSPARRMLRTSIEGLRKQLWVDGAAAPSGAGEGLFEAIERLPGTSEQQRSIRAAASQILLSLGRTRWLMHAQSGRSVLTPLLVIVAFWLTVIFVSFGLYAPRNAVVHVALFVCALSVASAIYLILEMDRPFQGMIRISDAPLRDVLSRIGQ
jgi:hypothetical protein